MPDPQVDLAWLKTHFPDLTEVVQIAGGGQKHVFTAVHPVDGAVVLKLMKPNVDLEGFRRELQAVAKLRSRRVPVIYGEGSVASPIGDCLWIREQRIIGASVREWIRPEGHAVGEVLTLLDHVLEAIVAAQENEIVHRDVKPDNVLRGNDGKFWLIDFGIARHLALSSLTPTAAQFGKATPGYAPLEQVQNRRTDIDTRADLYAIGVTAFECLTGKNPFREGVSDYDEVFERQEQTVALVLPEGVGGQRLADIIAALTQRDCAYRPKSAAEVRKWLSEIRTGRRESER